MRAKRLRQGALAVVLLIGGMTAGNAARNAMVGENKPHPRNLAQIDRCVSSADASSRIWACSLLLNGAPAEPPDRANYHLARGYAFLAFNWRDAALRDFAKTLELVPDKREVYQIRAQLYRQQRDYVRASQDLTALIALTPNDPLLYIWRGTVLDFSGAFDEAVADFSTAIAIAESYEPIADYYLARAAAYEREGRYDNALEDVDVALSRIGDQARGLEARGRLLYLQGRWSEAETALGHASAVEGASIYPQIWLHLVRQRLGKNPPAPASPAPDVRDLWSVQILDALEGRARVGDILPVTWSLDRDASLSAKNKLCELSYFVGEDLLARGNTDDARRYLAQAEKTRMTEVLCYHAARARLAQISSSPGLAR